MTRPAGDERADRSEAVGDGPASAVPTTDLHPADTAEEAARWAVEGVGIPDRSP